MNLIITDLQQDKALDTEAMLSVKGGFSHLVAPLYGPAFATVNDISKNLANINTQLNISVLSFGTVQDNSNNVFQF